jgi:hypothetical protein
MTGKAEFPKFKLELKKHQIVLPNSTKHGNDDEGQVPLIDVIVIQGNICDLDLTKIGKPIPKPQTLRSSPSRASFFTPSVSNSRGIKLPEIHGLTSEPGYILFMHKMGDESARPFVTDITKFLASFEYKSVDEQTSALNVFFEKTSKNMQGSYEDETELVLYGFHCYILAALYKQYGYAY